MHRHGRAIILIEGCDKAGKTTLAERLKERLERHGPARVVHFGVPDGNPFETYGAAIAEADAFAGSTIIDRLHWSNHVYQSLYRKGDGATKMEDWQHEELDRRLAAAGGVIVVRVRPVQELIRDMDADDYGKSRDADAIQRAFVDLFEDTPASRVTTMISTFPDGLSTAQLATAASLRTRSVEARGA